MTKKIISPILYVFSLALTLFVFILIVYFLDQHFANDTGLISVSAMIFFIGTSIFWLMNCFMAKLENLKNPKPIDHFRQSGVFYTLLPFVIYNLIMLFSEFRGCVMYGELAVIFVLSVWAIIINAVYLFLIRKRIKVDVCQ